MNALIEEYLRSTGVRYFRGHHDDEYFFLVDFLYLVDSQQGRLHVHLESCGPRRDSVQISITPDRYYPVRCRRRLSGLAARWIAENPGAEATLHDSSDPSLVGVSIQSQYQPADLASMTCFVDDCVASAIDLFGAMSRAAVPALRDAG